MILRVGNGWERMKMVDISIVDMRLKEVEKRKQKEFGEFIEVWLHYDGWSDGDIREWMSVYMDMRVREIDILVSVYDMNEYV